MKEIFPHGNPKIRFFEKIGFLTPLRSIPQRSPKNPIF